MRIQPGNADFGIFDAQGPAAGVRDPDAFQDTVLLYAVTGFAQRYMSGDVHDSEIFMGKHHRVFLRMREIRVDLGMTGIVMSGLVDMIFVQRVGDGPFDLPGHGQFDYLFYILKGTVAAHLFALIVGCLQRFRIHLFSQSRAVLAEMSFLQIQQSHVIDVDDAAAKLRVLHVMDRMNAERLRARHNLQCFLHGGCVAHDQGTAFLIGLRVHQRLDGNLRAVSGGIPHGDSKYR